MDCKNEQKDVFSSGIVKNAISIKDSEVFLFIAGLLIDQANVSLDPMSLSELYKSSDCIKDNHAKFGLLFATLVFYNYSVFLNKLPDDDINNNHSPRSISLTALQKAQLDIGSRLVSLMKNNDNDQLISYIYSDAYDKELQEIANIYAYYDQYYSDLAILAAFVLPIVFMLLIIFVEMAAPYSLVYVVIAFSVVGLMALRSSQMLTIKEEVDNAIINSPVNSAKKIVRLYFNQSQVPLQANCLDENITAFSRQPSFWSKIIPDAVSSYQSAAEDSFFQDKLTTYKSKYPSIGIFVRSILYNSQEVGSQP